LDERNEDKGVQFILLILVFCALPREAQETCCCSCLGRSFVPLLRRWWTWGRSLPWL